MFTANNLARNKPTNQSSTNEMYVSSKAVDGIRTNTLNQGSCSRTGYHDDAWWSVDLQAVYDIGEVVITGENTCKKG